MKNKWMKAGVNRRGFLTAAVRIPLLLTALVSGAGLKLSHALAAGGPALNEHQTATLLRLTYLLFPYPDLGMEPYQRIVNGMSETAVRQPDQLAMIKAGIGQLDDMGQRTWLGRPEDEQIKALKNIEGQAFFQWALRTTSNQLFQDRGLWELIGYEGSALEKGGYINRGLNDIDWL